VAKFTLHLETLSPGGRGKGEGELSIMNKNLLKIRNDFIEAAGRTTQTFGMGRLAGQLYTLLFFSPTPLCLDDFVKELGISKGSASTSVRELSRLGAVKRVWLKGKRKDYYEAVTDFWQLFNNGVLITLRTKLSSARGKINEAEESLADTRNESGSDNSELLHFYQSRLNKIKKTHKFISGILTNPILKGIGKL